jgi:hypothetical protein
MPKADSQFRPGQSGNPGGRPKGERSVREIAQQHTTAAMETLVHVMRTGKNSERVQAATTLLDRGWGKPNQSIEMTRPQLSLVDLLASLNTSSAVNGGSEAGDGGDNDGDLHRAADPVH